MQIDKQGINYLFELVIRDGLPVEDPHEPGQSLLHPWEH